MKQDSIVPLWMKISLVVTIGALLAGGFWFYQVQQRQQREEVEARLWSIAQLKANQIAEWRAERLSDAEILATRQSLVDNVQRFFTDPTAEISEKIIRYLAPFKERYHYADIILVDTDKRVRLSLEDGKDLHAQFAATLEAAFTGRKAEWTPLHIEPEYPFPHISVVAPIYNEVSVQPVGALILISNANQFLYPLVQWWPTLSKTAETLLVRRDGEDVLFLNELRHQKNTALKLRIPLSRADLPAAMAIAGKKGIVRGKDYRGVEVIAAILPIPDSPWFMVSKVDAKEAFAVWKFRSTMILLCLLGAVALLGTAALVVWQRSQKAQYRQLYHSEAALRASLEKQAVTLSSIGDAVISTDAGGRIELMNPVAEALTGWRHEEAKGKELSEVFHIINEETRNSVDDPVARVLKEGVVVGLANHTLLIAKDRREIPIADSGAPIRDDRGQIIGVVLVFRDQSEERFTQHLTEARLALIASAAEHTLDRFLRHALDEFCAIVDSPIGFYHFVETDQQTLSLQQWSTRTLQEFCRAEGRGLHYAIEQAGVWVECVHQKKPVIHNDYASLPHKKGLPQGHAEIIREMAAPVMREGKVVAILGVGNKPTDYTEKDVELVSYLADVIWEIVQHKRADESLQARERQLTTLMSNLPGMVYRCKNDPDWTMEFISDGCQPLTGYKPEELIGNAALSFATIIHPDDRAAVWENVQNTLMDNRPFQLTYRIKTAGGEEKWVWELGQRVVVRDSEEVVLEGFITDITELKRLDDALRASEEKFRFLAENMADIAWTMDLEFHTTYVSPSIEKVLGFTPEERAHQTLEEIFTPESLSTARKLFAREYENRIASGMNSGRAVTVELEFHHKSGATVWLENTMKWIRDTGGNIIGIHGVSRDISERRLAEVEREKLQRQLLQAQKVESVGRLAGGVAHDFNNQLGVILGYTELILSKMTSDDPLMEDLQQIQQAARSSANLTRQLLAFARKQTIAPRVLDLNDTLEGMLKMLRRLIGEDIDLLWKPDSHLWPVKMDPAQLDQILVNLCVNARDAIEGNGKVTMETQNAVIDQSYCADHPEALPGEYVMIAISDSGCGMEREVLNYIFEPFYTTKEVGKGTGLGLATVYGIVKQNDGFINVYSEPARGSTFKIYLPRRKGKAAEEEARPSQLVMSQGETVLVVEDDPGILTMGKAMLERLGYTVLTALLPDQAMKVAKEHPGTIHLLMTDVVMPQMSGKDLVARLKESRPQIKALYMSGYTADVIAHRGVLEGDVHFLGKPFSVSSLAAKVREVLDDGE